MSTPSIPKIKGRGRPRKYDLSKLEIGDALRDIKTINTDYLKVIYPDKKFVRRTNEKGLLDIYRIQ